MTPSDLATKALEERNVALKNEIESLKERLAESKSRVKHLEERDRLLGDFLIAFDRLRASRGEPASVEPVIASGTLGKWLELAGKRNACRRMLGILIKHREMTRAQLATQSIVSIKGSEFRKGMAWMRRNGLITVQGEQVRLVCP